MRSPRRGAPRKGTNLVNVLSLEPDEEITAILSVAEFTADEYLVMLTRQGVDKRVNLMAYRTRRTGGLYAVTLDEGDELLSVLKTDGGTSIIAATEKGYAIRFDENDVRCVGRRARCARRPSDCGRPRGRRRRHPAGRGEAAADHHRQGLRQADRHRRVQRSEARRQGRALPPHGR